MCYFPKVPDLASDLEHCASMNDRFRVLWEATPSGITFQFEGRIGTCDESTCHSVELVYVLAGA